MHATAGFQPVSPASPPSPASRTRREEIDELADAIAVHAARIDAATHELLTEIRRFDALGGWAWQGARSCAAWLSWRLGLGPGAAGEKVRVARALGEFPLIDAAFAAGELSYCKVRAMTRVATEATEARLLEMARHATGAQLEAVCRGFRRVRRAADAASCSNPADAKRAAGPDRYVQRRHLPDGMVRIEAQLLPDEAELIWQALEELRGELLAEARGATPPPGPEEPTEPERAADAPAPDPEPDAPAPGPERDAPGRDDLSAESPRLDPLDSDPTTGEDLSAESPLLDPSDPLAGLFAPERDEPEEPKGVWTRCEDTGELVYYGSDPPDEWPEEVPRSKDEARAEAEAAAAERARAQLPSPAQWKASRAGDGRPDLADALVLWAERTLNEPPSANRARAGSGAPTPGRARTRPLLLIHLSEDRLAQALTTQPGEAAASDAAHAADAADTVPFVAELHGGTWLGGDTLLRLACDAGVAVVKTTADGAVLDVGRRRRTVPPAILRALWVRDGCCGFPGCTSTAALEAHHVEHWARGGETRLDNLVLTCKRHHRALHEEGFAVSRADDGALAFVDPSGRAIDPAPPPATPPAGWPRGRALADLAADQQADGLVIHRTTSLPRWDGTPPDIGAAVAGLWRRHERAAAPR